MLYKKVIYAHGVHTGGGLTLLKEVFSALEGNSEYSFMLDKRCQRQASAYDLVNVEYFSPGLFGRLHSELVLKCRGEKVERVLSFNSLPFIFRLKCHVTIFFQNVNLLDSSPSGVSQRVKSFVFKFIAAEVNQFIVQTSSVSDLVSKATGASCNIGTLLERSLCESLHSGIRPPRKLNKETVKFVYIADASIHKNHITLIRAWKLIKSTFKNIDIHLLLTLDSEGNNLWGKLNAEFDMESLSVINLGQLPRDQVFCIYNECDALIFPSLNESFGLPLIEAAISNLDILASEKDFVRDVVSPTEVFNPDSYVSIARAIARYLELPWPSSTRPITALDLLHEVFDD